MAVKEKHSHYYKNVEHLKDIDAYRVLERFDVTDPAIQHAVKKLLVAGGRGAGKGQEQDVQEAIDSLHRFQEMRVEDNKELVSRGKVIIHAYEMPGMTPAKRKHMDKVIEDFNRGKSAKPKARKATGRRGR